MRGCKDRSKDTKMSTGFESNFMQFEADGRYNRVFDLAEEGVEGLQILIASRIMVTLSRHGKSLSRLCVLPVSDMDLLTKFPHRMEQLSSPLERRVWFACTVRMRIEQFFVH